MLMSKSRLEKFLYALYSLDSSDLPTPLSRIEELYKCWVTGEEAPTFEPLSRVEKYLMAILGGYDVDSLPNPLSRVEVLLYKLATGDDNLDDVEVFLSEHEELLGEIIRNGGAGGNINIEYVLYTLSTEHNTLYNTAEKPVKSAILKGMQSARMPVLKTVGKNLFDGKWEIGTIAILNGIEVETTSNIRSVNYINVKPNTAYVASSSQLQHVNVVVWCAYDKNKNFISSSVTSRFFTTPSNCEFIRVRTFDSDSTNMSLNCVLQIEQGLTATSYEPYKSNILTVNEDVTLRSKGGVYDELNLLNGRLTQRIDENNEVLAQEVVKTVDLSVDDQDGNDTKLSTFNDITHVTLSSEGLIPEVELEVAEKVPEVDVSMLTISREEEL